MPGREKVISPLFRELGKMKTKKTSAGKNKKTRPNRMDLTYIGGNGFKK
jgi:hypothetical protein